MREFFKAFAVAFSIYSKIPMPRFEWAGKDMRYHLCFFPLVGAVIGGLEFLWLVIWRSLCFSQILYLCGGLVIPVLVTGGFHIDGFMDTMDAVHSYKTREEKLEILSDPHIGAFSVISLAVLVLLCLGFGSEVRSADGAVAVCFSFFISRSLSGLSVVLFPKAKKSGMLASESETSSARIVAACLIAELLFALLAEFLITWHLGKAAIFSTAAQAVSFIFYYFFAKRQFGGITGDLAGFFVCVSELSSVIASSLPEIASVR